MGRPIKKIYFGNTGTPPIGGEGVASFTVGGTNNNYTTIPTITSIGAPNLPGGVQAVGAIDTMVAKTAIVTTSGTGSTSADYQPGDTLTVVGGTGTAATFTVASVKIRTVVTAAAGTNTWTTGDTVTFSTGWATPAVLTITDDGAGGIAGLTITNPGVLSGTVPADPIAPDSTTNVSGLVNGATFNIGFGVDAVTVDTAGSYTALPANPVATTTDSVDGTGATLTVSYGIGTASVSVSGSGYTAAPSVTLSGGNGTLTAVLSSTNPNAIAISAFVVGGSSAVAGDIVKQEASRRYLVTTAQGTSDCSLVAAPPLAGEMTMTATDSAGGTYYPIKLTQSQVTIVKGGRTGTQFDTHSFVIGSIVRSGGEVTVTTAAPHDFTDGAQIYIYGVTGATNTFNGVFNVNVTGASTFTYAQNGANESGTVGANSNASAGTQVDWVIAPDVAVVNQSVVIATV